MDNAAERYLEKSAVLNSGDRQVGHHRGTRLKQKKLIFSLAEEQYGIPLSSVKEVIGMVKVTPIPHMPSFFKGLINLRGKIISVIDLRLKLGFEEKAYEPKKTSIIISDVNSLTVGTIVDDVNEVIGFTDEQIETKIQISSSIKREYIYGVAKAEDSSLVLLLDILNVLEPEELDLISTHVSVQPTTGNTNFDI
ncbi:MULTISPECIES: chemotaxis protein CheW [Grimontia]|uniref:Chemotaxis protein CheW n=1 Tax=Grimontia marina TaxID=646534 RepID=A0A128F2S8_9GAMM|nr:MULTISPECIES: chemotaxis protein CheW [Grimontia]WRW00595.1 chemotaxis protein CheW [Grimontia sp. NTOU-MAR1]CZF80581.1 Chemotaxis protein CheW [Grimontia marina]